MDWNEPSSEANAVEAKERMQQKTANRVCTYRERAIFLAPRLSKLRAKCVNASSTMETIDKWTQLRKLWSETKIRRNVFRSVTPKSLDTEEVSTSQRDQLQVQRCAGTYICLEKKQDLTVIEAIAAGPASTGKSIPEIGGAR